MIRIWVFCSFGFFLQAYFISCTLAKYKYWPTTQIVKNQRKKNFSFDFEKFLEFFLDVEDDNRRQHDDIKRLPAGLRNKRLVGHGNNLRNGKKLLLLVKQRHQFSRFGLKFDKIDLFLPVNYSNELDSNRLRLGDNRIDIYIWNFFPETNDWVTTAAVV